MPLPEDGVLADIRVLDLSEGVAGPYCAKLLGDLGARTVKIEPPRGDWTRGTGPFPGDRPDPDKSGLFLYLNTSKSGLVLDLDRDADRQSFMELAAIADVVVESSEPGKLKRLGLDYAGLSRVNPALVMTSVTPFGRTGPYSDHPATDLTVSAMSGLMLATGEATREPLVGAGPRASYVAGMNAYVATLAALRARQRTERGQHVDVSMFESMVAVIECFTTVNSYNGDNWHRHGNRRTHVHPSTIYACREGYVQLHLLREEQWQGLCRVMKREDLPADPRFAMNVDRVRNADALDAEVAPWFRTHANTDVQRMCQAERVPVVVVADPALLATSPHLAARQYWAKAEHPVAGMLTYPGAPFKLQEKPWRMKSPAPRLGAATPESTREWLQSTPAAARSSGNGERSPRQGRPLEGMRILDLTTAWAGPYCTRVLAFLGATVIKVEGPDRPDVWRGAIRPKGFTERYPNHEYGKRPWNRNANFNSENHNKLACVIDLARPQGLEIAKRLVAASDAVIENFSARVMGKLGLGYPVLKEVNPRTILLSMPGYGLTGPQRDWVAWGPNIEANAGMCHLIGYRDGPPLSTGYAFCDPVAGLAGAAAFLTALAHRDATGRGQHVDLSHQEVGVGLLGEAMLDYFMNGRTASRMGNRHVAWAPQGCYPCAGDDRWITLTVVDDTHWRALCKCLDRPDWSQDAGLVTAGGRRSRHDELDEGIATWTRSRDRDDAWQALLAVGVPAGPAFTSTDLSRNPHLHARRFFDELDHPDCGRHPYPGLGINLSDTPGRVDWVSPAYAQHNDEVFRDIVGLSERELAELYELGITARQPRGAA